jgi:hypothetical protein
MPAIHAFCQKWHITELALFGSALRTDFHAESDLDLLVTFGDDVRVSLLDMVHMTDELEAIVGRKVDLLTRRSVEQSANYLRRRDILSSARVIYGAAR